MRCTRLLVPVILLAQRFIFYPGLLSALLHLLKPPATEWKGFGQSKIYYWLPIWSLQVYFSQGCYIRSCAFQNQCHSHSSRELLNDSVCYWLLALDIPPIDKSAIFISSLFLYTYFRVRIIISLDIFSTILFFLIVYFSFILNTITHII